MSHTPHELSADFPEHADRIHALRESDAHFRKLADAYHEANRAVHRAETNVEPCDQFREEALRKERMRLKDRIAAKLSGSICAAQPVTMIRASGFSRRNRRMSFRAFRTASAVTAQVFNTTASPSPACVARSFIASVS